MSGVEECFGMEQFNSMERTLSVVRSNPGLQRDTEACNALATGFMLAS